MREQPYFDMAGNEIMEGDLLRVWHFRERKRGKVHYMYHVVCIDKFKEDEYFSAKRYCVDGNKGHYWLKAVAQKETRQIFGCLIIDTIDTMRDLKRTPKKLNSEQNPERSVATDAQSRNKSQ